MTGVIQMKKRFFRTQKGKAFRDCWKVCGYSQTVIPAMLLSGNLVPPRGEKPYPRLDRSGMTRINIVAASFRVRLCKVIWAFPDQFFLSDRMVFTISLSVLMV